MNSTFNATLDRQILDFSIAYTIERSCPRTIGLYISGNGMTVTVEYTSVRLITGTNHCSNSDIRRENGVNRGTLSRIFDKILEKLPVFAALNDIIGRTTRFVLSIHLGVVTVLKRQRGGIVFTGKGRTAGHIERHSNRIEQAICHLDVGIRQYHTDETTVIISLIALDRA